MRLYDIFHTINENKSTIAGNEKELAIVVAEHLTDTERTFTPVIFDEEETEFIMRPVTSIGYHFKDQVSEIPVASEGLKLEVTDEATAGFVRDCLLYSDAGLQRIIDSYRRGNELDHEYARHRFTLAQHETMRTFMAKAEDKMRMSQQLIGRLGLDGAKSE